MIISFLLAFRFFYLISSVVLQYYHSAPFGENQFSQFSLSSHPFGDNQFSIAATNFFHYYVYGKTQLGRHSTILSTFYLLLRPN